MPVNDKKRILIVDDHSLVLEGLSHTLEKIPGIGEITALTDGTSATNAIKDKTFDIYILDLELPDMNGFELIENILKLHEQASIIVNTMHEEIWTVNRLLELGVQGIVLKSSSSVHRAKAIKCILEGKSYFCPRFEYLAQKHTNYRKQLENKNSLPTKRELEVLQLIAAGKTTEEISERLFISINTVESYRKNLMLKLNAKNMAHLVSIAIKKRLIEPF